MKCTPLPDWRFRKRLATLSSYGAVIRAAWSDRNIFRDSPPCLRYSRVPRALFQIAAYNLSRSIRCFESGKSPLTRASVTRCHRRYQRRMLRNHGWRRLLARSHPRPFCWLRNCWTLESEIYSPLDLARYSAQAESRISTATVMLATAMTRPRRRWNERLWNSRRTR